MHPNWCICFINKQYQLKIQLAIILFIFTSETVRNREVKTGAVNSVLAKRNTVVYQPIRVDTSRDAAAIAAYV